MPISHSDDNLLAVPGKYPAPLVIVHGCNCQGVWGRGIAEQLRIKYPDAYADYHHYSRSKKPTDLRGTARLFEVSHQVYIGSLYTSIHYRIPDPRVEILEATGLAVANLLQQVKGLGLNARYYSNKFNSGLFKVDWHYTEDALRKVLLDGRDVSWQVCTPPEHQ